MEIKKEYLGKVSATTCGEYDSTKDYPRLAIVYTTEDISDSFGTRTIIKSYISKQSVPAGTELTNVNYWQPFSITPDGVVTTEDIGKPGRVASLNELGLIPSEQLPSYVDDVLEFVNRQAFPSTGERGKIYIDMSTNDQYRWSGSTYILVTKSKVISDIIISQQEAALSLILSRTDNTTSSKEIPAATNSNNGVVKFGGTQMGSDDSLNSAPVRPQSDNRMGVAPATIQRSGVILPTEKSEIIKLPYSLGRAAASSKYIIYLMPAGETDLNNAISYAEIREATTNLAGIMTAGDKTKLNNIQNNANLTKIKYEDDYKPLSNLVFDSMFELGEELDSDNNPTGTYVVVLGPVTETSDGAMRVADKIKLDGIETNANNYTLPVATSGVLGGVKFGGSTMGTADATAAAPVRPTNASGIMGVALATDSRSGAMSATDKIKIDSIDTSVLATQSDVSTAVDAEASLRHSADQTLQDNIDAVASRKINKEVANGKVRIVIQSADGQTTYSFVDIYGASNAAAGMMSSTDKTKLDNWKTVKVRFDDGTSTTDTEVANPILDITGNVIPLIHSQNLIRFDYNLPTASSSVKGGIKVGNVISDTQDLSNYGSASITGVYDDSLLIKLATPGSTGNDGLMSKVDKTRLDSLNTIKNALPSNVDPNLIFFITISSTGSMTECTYVGDFSTYSMTKCYKVFVSIDSNSTAYTNLYNMPQFEETYITTVKELSGGTTINQNRAYLPICSILRGSPVYVDFSSMGDSLYGTLYGL